MIIPVPKYNEPEPVSVVTRTLEWYKWYLGCPNYICSKCRTTNFGRNKQCARCKDPRPTSYVEDVYTGSE